MTELRGCEGMIHSVSYLNPVEDDEDEERVSIYWRALQRASSRVKRHLISILYLLIDYNITMLS